MGFGTVNIMFGGTLGTGTFHVWLFFFFFCMLLDMILEQIEKGICSQHV